MPPKVFIFSFEQNVNDFHYVFTVEMGDRNYLSTRYKLGSLPMS